ncbi:hypothetical protein [Teichococcus aestuarii]|uniref:hypothetical protein n=1 Tax=Teichococcus aestuarii TaxID=568898 RepID=UPI00361774A2
MSGSTRCRRAGAASPGLAPTKPPRSPRSTRRERRVAVTNGRVPLRGSTAMSPFRSLRPTRPSMPVKRTAPAA